LKKLLVINASARTAHSYSRSLTEVFVNHWSQRHTNIAIAHRDLGNESIAHINEEWITAGFTPPADRTLEQQVILGTSDAYINELRDADVIVLGTPMYNWSIPSTLKAYIDQVLRLNETFSVNFRNPTNPYIGLLQNKKVVMLVARGGGGYEPDQANEHLNYQTTYLKTIFKMMGIEQVHVISIDGTSLDKEILKGTVAQAHQQVKNLIEGIELS